MLNLIWPSASDTKESVILLYVSPIHSGSFDEFYYCLKFAYNLKKLVKSWQFNIGDKHTSFISRVLSSYILIFNDTKIRQNYHCAIVGTGSMRLPWLLPLLQALMELPPQPSRSRTAF